MELLLLKHTVKYVVMQTGNKKDKGNAQCDTKCEQFLTSHYFLSECEKQFSTMGSLFSQTNTGGVLER